MKRIHLKSRGMAAGVVLAAVGSGLAIAPAAQAAVRPAAACTNPYVVASVPLTDQATGVSSWSYGYVQLWYSAACGENWARDVYEAGGTISTNHVEVDRADGAWEAANCSGTICVSPGIYSPSQSARAGADVYLTNGAVYYGWTNWY